jgi:5-methylcytosine-specific restriction endonuclease McrA
MAAQTAKTAASLAGKSARMMGGLMAAGFGKARVAVARKRFEKKLPGIFLQAAADGRITEAEEAQLRQAVNDNGWNWAEAIEAVQPQARDFVRRVLADVAADGIVSAEERAEVLRYMRVFDLASIKPEVDTMFSRLETIWSLSNGRLPTILDERPIWLRSDEGVYFFAKASYLKERRQNLIECHGDLYVTNTRVEFISGADTCSHPFEHLRECDPVRRTHLSLLFHPRQGSGTYIMDDAPLAAAFISCLARAANRTISISRDDDTTQARRRIPAETRKEVWLRDGGKCTDCAAEDYLEFDHIIPVTKGGANTAQNVQLLCRRCNAKKSDRI